MGVQVGESTGEHPGLLQCESCGEYYETDETMANDCPHCGAHRFRMVTLEPAERGAWRDDPEQFDAERDD